MTDVKLKKLLDTDYPDILNKYYNLVNLQELSEFDGKSLDKILEQAETDEKLSLLLNEIDELTFEESGFYDKKNLEQIEQQKEKTKQDLKRISYLDVSPLKQENSPKQDRQRERRKTKFNNGRVLKLALHSIATSMTILACVLLQLNNRGRSLSSQPSLSTGLWDEQPFVCGKTSQGQLATMANTSRGKIPIIIWESNYFSDSGWTPKKRCMKVTERFIKYSEKGWLNYITIDQMNNQNVLVATESPDAKRLDLVNGGLLITLRGDQDSNTELEKLMQVRDGASYNLVFHSVEGAQVFDSQGRLYINLEVFLSKAQV